MSLYENYTLAEIEELAQKYLKVKSASRQWYHDNIDQAKAYANEYNHKHQNETKHQADRCGSWYMQWEDEIILEQVPKIGVAETARLLNRTFYAVRHRYSKLRNPQN